MVTTVTTLRSSAATNPATAWQLVVRTAVAASLIMMALAYALHTFVQLSDIVVVAIIATIGLVVGSLLPAATPPIPDWLLDEDEAAASAR